MTALHLGLALTILAILLFVTVLTFPYNHLTVDRFESAGSTRSRFHTYVPIPIRPLIRVYDTGGILVIGQWYLVVFSFRRQYLLIPATMQWLHNACRY
jgi:hypothetical protein